MSSPVPCTPIRCKRCSFVYHWRGRPSEVVRLRPVEEGLCPACWSGRLPAVHAKCVVCDEIPALKVTEPPAKARSA